MKYMRFLALLPFAILLAGCGGGGGGNGASSRTATVTFKIDWPVAAARSTRVIPTSAANLLIEAFVGSSPIQSAIVTPASQNSAAFSVPLTGVTIFVTAFGPTAPVGYATDPKSGQIFHNGVPLTSAEANPPLARGVTTLTVTKSTTVDVTMNNAVATLTAANPGSTHVTVSATPVNLSSLIPASIQAKDANGAVVLVTAGELSWSLDPTDSLASTHVSLSGASATFLAAGPVRLVVQDNNVNPGQAPIQAVIGFTIDLPSPVTLAVDSTRLQNFTPLYAKSVKLTLTEAPLGADDNPAPAISQTFNMTAFNRALNTVTLPAVSLAYTPSGRAFTFTIEAWSAADGKGVLLAATSRGPIGLTNPPFTAAGSVYTFNQPVFAPADYKISGFVAAVSPANIYFLNAGQSGDGLTPTAQAAVTLAVAGQDTRQAIDPASVTLTALPASAATVDNATGVVTAKAVGAATPATVTAADSKATATVANGTATVTVNPVVGSAGLGIK
jgi:hypothetical protein